MTGPGDRGLNDVHSTSMGHPDYLPLVKWSLHPHSYAFTASVEIYRNFFFCLSKSVSIHFFQVCSKPVVVVHATCLLRRLVNRRTDFLESWRWKLLN